MHKKTPSFFRTLRNEYYLIPFPFFGSTPLTCARVDRTESIAGETVFVAFRKEDSLLSLPYRFDPFVIALPPRQVLEMVPKHETIPHYTDAHFLQIVVSQKRREFSGYFVLLERFKVGAESPLSKIRAELTGVPRVIVGEVVAIAIVVGHTLIVAACCAHWCGLLGFGDSSLASVTVTSNKMRLLSFFVCSHIKIVTAIIFESSYRTRTKKGNNNSVVCTS